MAKISHQKVDKSGSVKTYSTAAAGGDTFDSFNGIFVNIKNGHASVARTVTIAAVDDPIITTEAGSLAVPDVSVNVPALGDAVFSVPQSHLSAGGLASMTYDDEADLTVAVFHVEQ